MNRKLTLIKESNLFIVNPSTETTGARIFHKLSNSTGRAHILSLAGIIFTLLAKRDESSHFMYQKCTLCQGKIDEEKYGSPITKFTWNSAHYKWKYHEKTSDN